MSASPNDDLFALIGHCLPRDHARQVNATYFIDVLASQQRPLKRVLDVGCGNGRSVDVFRRNDPGTEWHGLDIESSPEVAARTRTDANFHTYDGKTIPFDDATFDVVYSSQVFEHVRHPDIVLREITRVLRPGGAFIGSVSALEPYHSFSFWSFTPFGWYTLLQDAGMTPIQFRPGIDGVSLIQRSYLGRPEKAKTWFDNSPLNLEIDAWGANTKRSNQLINLRKVQYCGHLCFWADKKAP